MSDENNFIPEYKTYKKISPFQIFMKNTFPFIENTFMELDNYSLLCKITEYLNKVIENENTVESNVDNLFNSFVSLNEYVSNYFDNLDVQEEINNKLDEMAKSGQLQSIISDYFNEINLSISELNSKINLLESRMDSFTHLEEGSTTGDAELTDGRIAFDGTVYDNIGDNIRNNQGLFWEDITETLPFEDGKYVINSGNFNTSENYMVYTLQTEIGYDYYIDTYTGDYSPQVFLNYAKTIPETVSSGGRYKDLIYIKGNGNKILINKWKSQYCHVYRTKKIYNINNMDTYFRKIDDTEITTENGKYINNNGNIISVNAYNLHSITTKKSHIYIIKSRTSASAPLGYQKQPIPYKSTDNNYNFIKGLYYYIALEDNILYINEYTRDMKNDNFEIYESFLPIYKENDDYNGLIDNAVFIGDSLTYGQTYIGNSQSYRNYYNYPYFLKKLLQINTITEIARPGYTAESWWNNYENSIVDENSVYFVWLGTNSNFTDTVETDCAGTDYSTYSNTETGYMGKILAKISSLTNNKIIILNNFATVGTLSTNNKVISDFANKFNCILVDVNISAIHENKYHTSYNGYFNNVHFNNLGHNFVANIIKEKLHEEIEENGNIFEFYKTY